MAKAESGTSKREKQKNTRWVVTIFFVTIFVSGTITLLSDVVMDNSSIWVAFLILLAIVSLGIIFDVIGVAVTSADEKPFHSMAAKKVPGAREAIRLLRNAGRVSSICNDVVGDICGIVSGSTAAVIVTELQRSFSTTTILISIGTTALISGLTIGGKALFKRVAIEDSTKVVYRVARIMNALHLFR